MKKKNGLSAMTLCVRTALGIHPAFGMLHFRGIVQRGLENGWLTFWFGRTRSSESARGQ